MRAFERRSASFRDLHQMAGGLQRLPELPDNGARRDGEEDPPTALAVTTGQLIGERLEPDQRANPGHQLIRIDWLVEEIVGAVLQGLHAVALRLERAHHHDRYL